MDLAFIQDPEVPASTNVESLIILDVTNGVAYVKIDENAPCVTEHVNFEDDRVEEIVAKMPRPGKVADEKRKTLSKVLLRESGARWTSVSVTLLSRVSIMTTWCS